AVDAPTSAAGREPAPGAAEAAPPASRPRAGELLRIEVPFGPNEVDFAAAAHGDDFARVLALLQATPGARVVIEGTVDASRLARARREGATPLDLMLLEQQARNLSLRRALAVRSELLLYCAEHDPKTDPRRFLARGRTPAAEDGAAASRGGVVIRLESPPAGAGNVESESAP
ncbi:MAG: hypothetical protein D6696_18295, partial [Acidobacteria bacterium]